MNNYAKQKLYFKNMFFPNIYYPINYFKTYIITNLSFQEHKVLCFLDTPTLNPAKYKNKFYGI